MKQLVLFKNTDKLLTRLTEKKEKTEITNSRN